MIKRSLEFYLATKLQDNKAIILLGPRQTGKSTFIQMIRDRLKQPVAWWNGDDPFLNEYFLTRRVQLTTGICQ